MNKIWTIGSILQWTQQYFDHKGIESPRLDAEILLSHVLCKERIYLYAHYDEPLNADELAAYREVIQKRANRLSVAHILGKKAFMGLDFKINTDVLVPRPETEMLVESILEREDKNKELSILDIGTGSGAILISLAYYMKNIQGTGVDISPQALAVAKENSESLGVSGRLTWLESDLFANVPNETFDWIVSNPPYLTSQDMEILQPEVRYDPECALYGGSDGLDLYRRLASDSPKYVKSGGCVAVEIGKGQEKSVISIFTEGTAYEYDKTVKDYGGIDRVLLFTRKE